MVNNFMAISAVSMCALGIGLCIYLLITSKVDTKLPTSNMLICFFGLGWMSFLMQCFSHITIGCFFGILFFFIGYSIWAYKHLKIIDHIYKTIFNKEN